MQHASSHQQLYLALSSSPRISTTTTTTMLPALSPHRPTLVRSLLPLPVFCCSQIKDPITTTSTESADPLQPVDVPSSLLHSSARITTWQRQWTSSDGRRGVEPGRTGVCVEGSAARGGGEAMRRSDGRRSGGWEDGIPRIRGDGALVAWWNLHGGWVERNRGWHYNCSYSCDVQSVKGKMVSTTRLSRPCPAPDRGV